MPFRPPSFCRAFWEPGPRSWPGRRRARARLDATAYPTKGILYLGGLTEGFETISLFLLFCLFPAAFPWLAYAFALACLMTILIRIRLAWLTLTPTLEPK